MHSCFPMEGLDFIMGSDIIGAENSWISASQIWLLYFNSCLNPVIYAFYPWFRKVVKHIVTLQILQPGSSEANIL
ncbi:trace amine-associated receptor 9-like protein [Lates japonicus]|uniref:Trace amine-associated receptor 9-like protein n=1 Tax=Lates japonicus TaxID=270547 RepID=A0AAD3RGQ0_LATJO|nr:trace amine-associated receptor 9-like protein [Lates japonicus]